MTSTRPLASAPIRQLAEQALSRAAGAPLLGGNSATLLIDAAAHFDAWLAAIRGARQSVLLENYIVRDDEVGRAFRDALVECAQRGVFVAVVYDWLGCKGQSRARFWTPLRAAGGQVRVFNPPQFGQPLAGSAAITASCWWSMACTVFSPVYVSARSGWATLPGTWRHGVIRAWPCTGLRLPS